MKTDLASPLAAWIYPPHERLALVTWLDRLFRRSAPDRAEAAARRLEAAIAEYNARRWPTAEPLFRGVVDDPAASPHDRHVARNILGALLYRVGRIDEAAASWEANVAERFAGSYPYERLAALYRQRGQSIEALRVLRQAVVVVQAEVAAGRREAVPQLERLQRELAQADAEAGPPAPS